MTTSKIREAEIAVEKAAREIVKHISSICQDDERSWSATAPAMRLRDKLEALDAARAEEPKAESFAMPKDETVASVKEFIDQQLRKGSEAIAAGLELRAEKKIREMIREEIKATAPAPMDEARVREIADERIDERLSLDIIEARAREIAREEAKDRMDWAVRNITIPAVFDQFATRLAALEAASKPAPIPQPIERDTYCPPHEAAGGNVYTTASAPTAEETSAEDWMNEPPHPRTTWHISDGIYKGALRAAEARGRENELRSILDSAQFQHDTYNGGHHEADTNAAFHHGMQTVFNILKGRLDALLLPAPSKEAK